MSATGKDALIADFIAFLNEACTAFHAVEASERRLVAAGFTKVAEAGDWSELRPGGKYYFTRNRTTLIAFTIGGGYELGNGFTILGAHTDSPCLRIKPVTCTQKQYALMLNTQPYGGGLWHTWFDRDLGLAGRVLLKGPNGEINSRLVRIDEPIARIPNLSIHLTSGSERESFTPNLHEHAKALLTISKGKMGLTASDVSDSEHTGRIHPLVLSLVADKLGVSPADIEDVELQLTDIQPTTLGGADSEFVFSGRLDNLCSTFQSLRALIDGSSSGIETQTNVRMAMLFDHEECGSSSTVGAGSSLFMDTLKSIVEGLAKARFFGGLIIQTLRKSFVVSADMAHGLHPNYPAKHDATMAPVINGGMVIKHNPNQRYATNAISATLFRRFGKMADVPVQEFTVRADSACGSTIGPIISTLSGILTVDCGSPQFSMHSIREMMGKDDVFYGYAILLSTLENHPKLASMTDLS